MIFPQPKYEAYYDGKYKMKECENTQDLVYLYNKYKQGDADVMLEKNDTYGEDKHDIFVNADGIKIVYGENSGIFCAVATLKQMFREYGDEIPYCEIKNAPDFKKRGYMLDISRGRMPKVRYIKRLIDVLADLKYNEFQLYMESFVFKYKAYPKYTADFDCLTPEDIEELDQYCADRFIDLVPNQNGFGHMATWLAEDEFKHLDVSGGTENTGTINPLLPETFEFMDNLYESLLPHFRSEYVNIGLDEARGLGKFALEDICNEIGRENVFMDWLNKLADHLRAKYNKKVQFWSDMVCNYPESFKRVPEGAVALNWGYDLNQNVSMDEQSRDLDQNGVEHYICPGNNTWMSYTGRFDLARFNIQHCGEVGRRRHAKGYLLTDWGTHDTHTQFPVWSLLSTALGAQYAWNVGEEQDGGRTKNPYVHKSMQYIDNAVFDGVQVSNWLYKMQQFYLLEPERIHNGTMCGYIFRFPITETAFPRFFDIKESGDAFYFENIIAYMKKAMDGFNELDIDDGWRRQVLVNCNMVIFSAELCLIRLSQTATNEKIDELVKMADEIADEYATLWDIENYPKGKDHYLNQVADRRKELIAMKK